MTWSGLTELLNDDLFSSFGEEAQYKDSNDNVFDVVCIFLSIDDLLDREINYETEIAINNKVFEIDLSNHPTLTINKGDKLTFKSVEYEVVDFYKYSVNENNYIVTLK